MIRLPAIIGVVLLVAAAATAAVRPLPTKPAPTPTAVPVTPTAVSAATPSAAPTSTVAKPSPYSLEGMTLRAADLQDKIAAAPPAQKKALQEQLELLYHQIGPRDAEGTPVKCQAMWHDAELDILAINVKHLSAVHAGTPTPADDLRLYTRRVAMKCIDEGWALPAGRAKFQIDAFGSYLANNLGMLDGLFGRVSAWMLAVAKSTDPADEVAAHQAAVKAANESITAMAQAADALDAAKPGDEKTTVPILESYVSALRTLNEADEAMQARAKAPTAAAATPTAPAGPATSGTAGQEEAEPPPMTEDERTRIAAVADTARKLVGEGWEQIIASIIRYAGAVEAGFQIPAARPRAREFLSYIERVTALSQELAASKAAYPEYLKDRQAAIGTALAQLGDSKTRARGYAVIDALWQADELRRQVERSGISVTAQQGIIYAYYVVCPQESAAAAAKDEPVPPATTALSNACRTVAATLEKTRGGPPKTMAAALKLSFDRQQTVLRTDLELAGQAYPSDRPNGLAKLRDAATRAADLELIIRVDAALAVITRLRPIRTAAMSTQAAKLAQDLASSPDDAAAPRKALTDLILPLEDLGRFPTLNSAETLAATGLGGREYSTAAVAFQQRAGAAIDLLSTGNASAVKTVVLARPLFTLTKHLAGAEAYRLERAPVSDLAVFSMPDKVWSPVAAKVGQSVRLMLAQYVASTTGRGTWEKDAPVWDSLCQPVAAARRVTVDARLAGETDLEFLVRNLEHVAVPAPSTQAWYGWASGYHATEAAVCLAAGLDNVAAWHRDQLSRFDGFLLTIDLEPPKGR